MKGYTDFIDGFMGFQGKKNNTDGMRFMDWERAEKFCQEHPNNTISAGLREDWNNTSGVVFSHGSWVDGYVYGGSRWATPILNIDETDEEFECWSNINNGVDKPDWWGRGEKLIGEFELEGEE